YLSRGIPAFLRVRRSPRFQRFNHFLARLLVGHYLHVSSKVGRREVTRLRGRLKAVGNSSGWQSQFLSYHCGACRRVKTQTVKKRILISRVTALARRKLGTSIPATVFLRITTNTTNTTQGIRSKRKPVP